MKTDQNFEQPTSCFMMQDSEWIEKIEETENNKSEGTRKDRDLKNTAQQIDEKTETPQSGEKHRQLENTKNISTV